MSHKRKGQLTVSGEWAQHLRPILRRAFWRQERQAADALVRDEQNQLRAAREDSGTVEGLLAELDALPLDATHVELWVPAHLTYREAEVAQDLAMALLLDRLLERGLFPQGFRPHEGGRLYRYQATNKGEGDA